MLNKDIDINRTRVIYLQRLISEVHCEFTQKTN